MTIKLIYDKLYEEYGAQGWWPIVSLHDCGGVNPTKTGSINGYHVLDYSHPQDRNERFEIIIGALLTQNTSWPQVEKSLLNLKDCCGFSPEEIVEVDLDKLKNAIKPSGYFNQKAERLKLLAEWFIELGEKIPSRNELLGLKGVGPETADSILLYAFSQPSFVVDSYTKRIMLALNLIDDDFKYDDIKVMFEKGLESDAVIFQEYHALLVEHAKRYYTGRGESEKCFLKDMLTHSS